MYMACPFESELKPHLRSDLECDEKKKKQARGNLSHPLHFLCVGRTCLYANAGPVTPESRQKAACLNGAAGSIPPDPGTRVGFDQPREKNVNICLSPHGKWPIINFFSASLNCSQTKPPSCRLCCLRHFPPPLHL